MKNVWKKSHSEEEIELLEKILHAIKHGGSGGGTSAPDYTALLTQISSDLSVLKSEVETFLRPRIVFYYKGQIARGLKMKDTEKVTLTIELDDAKGFPVGAGFDQPPVYTIDDDTIASLAPAADGMSCDVIALKPGNVNVSVAGVAAGNSYAGTVAVPITAGDAVSIKLTLGTPVAQ